MFAMTVLTQSQANEAVWAPYVRTADLETNTVYPLLIKQSSLGSSMRYQQVYNSSLFHSLGNNIYLNDVIFLLEAENTQTLIGWSVPQLQVNLSTTQKSAGTLSPVFSENVGPDDQVVFGPEAQSFFAISSHGYIDLPQGRSFRYNPSQGNLLLDIRILDGTGPFDWNLPSLEAFDSSTDEVSRAWSSSVASTTADGVDTLGLTTLFEFSPDFFIRVPVTNTLETGTYLPLLIKQSYSYLNLSNVLLSTHYQQVYSAALFSNLDPSLVYLTSLTFFLNSPYTNRSFYWAITNLQIRLSTTTNSVGGLSQIFAQNVGVDEVLVFNGTNQFLGNPPEGPLPIYLTRPFKYNPARGNLLLDIRLSEPAGFDFTDRYDHYLAACASPTGQVSRVWSTNLTSISADRGDSTGLVTVFQFNSVPSLEANFFPVAFDGETNIIEVSWPSQPSIFQLQQSAEVGSNASWHGVTNQILGSVQGGGWFIWVPAKSAGTRANFRLIWPEGK